MFSISALILGIAKWINSFLGCSCLPCSHLAFLPIFFLNPLRAPVGTEPYVAHAPIQIHLLLLSLG